MNPIQLWKNEMIYMGGGKRGSKFVCYQGISSNRERGATAESALSLGSNLYYTRPKNIRDKFPKFVDLKEGRSVDVGNGLIKGIPLTMDELIDVTYGYLKAREETRKKR